VGPEVLAEVVDPLLPAAPADPEAGALAAPALGED
jgi:hypothetical protein